MPVTLPTLATVSADADAAPGRRTVSVTLAAETGEPSLRSVRWIRKTLARPAVRATYSKKFSTRNRVPTSGRNV